MNNPNNITTHNLSSQYTVLEVALGLDNKTLIMFKRQCIFCGGETQFITETNKYNEWRNGNYIQNIWPEVSKNIRETMINGTHTECFDKMFKEQDIKNF